MAVEKKQKKAFLALFWGVLAVFCFAGSVGAADVRPFKFKNASSDLTAQQGEWNKLIRYKLFGTGTKGGDGIHFKGMNTFITDSLGYVGSAKGNLNMTGNIHHIIGGPILFGGSYRNSDGTDTLLTGPVRFDGDFVSDFNGRNTNYFVGDYCIGGKINDIAARGVSVAHGTVLNASSCTKGSEDDVVKNYNHYCDELDLHPSKCDDSTYVPLVDRNLDIPELDTNVTWLPGITAMDPTQEDSVYYIDIPPNGKKTDICATSGVCDLFFESIAFKKTGKLVFRMPPNGRLTRVFVKESITNLGIGSYNNIEILQAPSNDLWDGEHWNIIADYGMWPDKTPSGKDTTVYKGKNIVPNKSYGGNLLFYLNEYFEIGASKKNIQGTFIVNDDILIKQHTSFAGQLMAKKITIDAEFRAQDFRYVPFDPPIMELDLFDHAVLNEGPEFVDKAQYITLELSKTPMMNISMKYCFEFSESANKHPEWGREHKNDSASYADVDLDRSELNLCKDGSKELSLSAGETKTVKIKVYVVDDTLSERAEYFRLKFFDMNGAVLADGSRSGYYDIKIVDDDDIPLSKDGSITGFEDEVLHFNDSSFYAVTSDSLPLDGYSIVFVSVPTKGSFLFNDKKVTIGDTVVSTELDNLTFLSKKNDFGSPYASFTYILLNEQGNATESTYKFTINMDPSNDAPSIVDTTFTVAEDTTEETVGKEVGKVLVKDIDKEEEFLKNELSIISGDKEYFDIDKKTGIITTKKPLDYEADTVLVIKVLVNDGTNKDTAEVVVRISNIVEKSTIEITRFETGDGVVKCKENCGNTFTMNEYTGTLSWEADGQFKFDTTLVNLNEGMNKVILTYENPTKDVPAKKEVIIFVSTKSPDITLAIDSTVPFTPNIYTIVEPVDEKDTTIYINPDRQTLVVTVKEPVLDSTYTDSTCNYQTRNFEVPFSLNPQNVSSSDFETIKKIAGQGLMLDIDLGDASQKTIVNDSLYLRSYDTKVAGKNVTVSYYTDKEGNVIKNADGTEVITVSFAAKSNGKNITLSYEADAMTGTLIPGPAEGVFMVNFIAASDSNSKTKASYYLDESGKIIEDNEKDVGYRLEYTYTNAFGNTAVRSIYVVMDAVKPKVLIVTPEDKANLSTSFVSVDWCVDLFDGKGCLPQDSLNMQALETGWNEIARYYRDKAGNVDSMIISVFVKEIKDIAISLEKNVSSMTPDKVDEYYSVYTPVKGQSYGVSLLDPSANKEVETIVGGSFGSQEGSGNAPYGTLEGHLGPTLIIDVRAPMVNAVGGLATLDDIVSNGYVALDGVDAAESKKISVDEYVETYCSEDFQDKYFTSKGDISKLSLFDTKLFVKIWVYTNLGHFVDYFKFTQEMNDPDFISDAGLLKIFFEQKPNEQGEIKDSEGRNYATGSYLYKTESTMRSTLSCTLPPISDENKKGRVGEKRKEEGNILVPFGYKRPPKK
ncbi:MAG: cadherin repeat domain-containing protein [Fibrobacteraceae bacterium]|nr:cadherin repeat domain-containing protein [Fibrobacteraceae bacterium]